MVSWVRGEWPGPKPLCSHFHMLISVLCPQGKLLEPHKYATLQKLDDPNEICAYEAIPSTTILKASYVCEVARNKGQNVAPHGGCVRVSGVNFTPTSGLPSPGYDTRCGFTYMTLNGFLFRPRSATSS